MTTQAEARRRRKTRNRIERDKIADDILLTRPGIIKLADMVIDANRRPHQPRETKTQIETLEARRAITERQFIAARRFLMDWHKSGLNPWASKPDTSIGGGGRSMPGCGPTYVQYMEAYKALGPLGHVVCQVVLYDQAPSEWARDRSAKDADGIACLRFGLDALSEYYWLEKRPPSRV